MNRIYRLVFNRTTGLMQVASELATTHAPGHLAAGRGGWRRLLLSTALQAALLLCATALPSANAAVFDFTADETINDSRVYVDGFRIAPAGQAFIALRNGGRLTSNDTTSIGTTAGSRGSLHIHGSTSSLSVNLASMRVGDAGLGDLRLYDGAIATVANGTLSFGHDAGSDGVGQVYGVGSMLSARQIEVGRQGSGVLSISHGGRVETTLASPPTNTFGMGIGLGAGSTGVVNVYTGGELRIRNNNLWLGQGILQVESGHAVIDRSLVIGAVDQSTGHAIVHNGGTLEAELVSIGAVRGASGTLQVSGAGSNVTAETMRVSANGDGLLRIESGGVVEVSGTVTAEDNQGLPDRSPRVGNIEVTGTGSLLRADRVVASPHLQLEAGGQIHSGSARIKDSYSGTAIATITGGGTRWDNQGDMDVRANLRVLDGAVVSTDTLSVIGGTNFARLDGLLVTEQVVVSGKGSAIEASRGIAVGNPLDTEPLGFLSASSGGRIAAGGTLTLRGNGFLAIGGGLQEWSEAEHNASWLSPEAPGQLDDSEIVMEVGSGGLVLNHTGNLTLDNTLTSVGSSILFPAGQVLSLAGSTTLGGDLAGFSGGIRVSGGTLVINSDSHTGKDYSGTGMAEVQAIDVQGGTLVLNGTAGFQQSISYGGRQAVERSSRAVVSGGGVLAGNATVGATLVHGGVLSPGNGGIGVLTIDGDLEFNATDLMRGSLDRAFYDVDVLGNGRADLITVTGKARIGHRAGDSAASGDTAVRVTGLDPATSYQSGQSYVILEAAGGLKGGFDQAVSNSAFITPALAHTGNQVLLTIAVNATAGPGTPGTPLNPGAPGMPVPVVFGAVAVTANQQATAAALDSLQQSGEALALYNGLLMLDGASALAAFDELSGEMHASNRGLLLGDRFLREGVSQRLRPDPTMVANGTSVWLAGGGASKRQGSDGHAAGSQEQRQGLIAGFEGSFGEGWSVGVAAGPESLRQQIRAHRATTEVDAMHGGLYAGFRGEEGWLNGGASYVDYDVQSQRSVGANSAWAQSLQSRYDARAVSVFAEGGWDIAFDAGTLTPYVALAHTRLSSDAAVETGGNAALEIAASKDEVWTTTVGLRAAWDISGGQQDAARLEAGLAWQNADGEVRPDARNRFAAGSDSFAIKGLSLARNVGIAELGISLKPSDNSRLSLFAQGRAGDGVREFGAQLNWDVRF